jgi:hypothetical protein
MAGLCRLQAYRAKEFKRSAVHCIETKERSFAPGLPQTYSLAAQIAMRDR